MIENQIKKNIWLTAAFALACFMLMFVDVSYARQNKWNFDVLLDGRHVGFHRYVITDFNEGFRVISEANYRVKFMFVTVYRYEHFSDELWQDDCLAEIISKTNDNGSDYQVIGESRKGEFIWTVGQTEQRNSICTKTFAYWDSGILQSGKLLNPQNGKLVDIKFNELGTELVPVGKQRIPSRKYRLVGKDIQIELWYSKNGVWLALE